MSDTKPNNDYSESDTKFRFPDVFSSTNDGGETEWAGYYRNPANPDDDDIEWVSMESSNKSDDES